MDDETIAGELDLDFSVPEHQPPDYLVSLYMALNQLTEVRRDILVSDLADTQGRYASIAITDLEKLIAFVSIYLTND